MPKKKTKAKSKKSLNFLAKLDKANSTLQRPKVLISVIFLIIAGVLAVRFVVNTYQASQVKQDFLAKHQELEKIADKISAQNKPDERKSFQKCRYQSAKFEKGKLYCYFGAELVYEQADFTIANTIKNESSALTAGTDVHEYLKPKSPHKDFVNNYDLEVDELIQYLLWMNEEGNCKVFYHYPDNNENSLTIRLSCSIFSKAEHFPIEK